MPSAKVAPAEDAREKTKSKPASDFSDTSWLIRQESDDERKQRTSNEITPYQKVVNRLNSDEEWHKEINLEKRVGFYKLRGEIGSGNFSQVKLGVHHLTRERVAIKILDKSKLDPKTQRMLSREISSMESLHHPHIIRLFEVIETLSKVYLVMEFAKGGELFHKISNDGKFDESQARSLFAQVIDAVDHMHRHNIIHRDLKAENVFFSTPNTVKVGDFGFSIHVRRKDDALRTFCGSPPYAAPELFHDDSYLGPSVDIWALGVLLYFMLTASMPFKSQTVSGLKKSIVDGQFSIPGYLSSDCQWLIYGMLRRKPTSRLGLEQIKSCRWLYGQKFHTGLPKYSIKPPESTCESSPNSVISLSKEETVATRRLKELGITDNMIRYSWERGVRSSITGTYRILLHRLVDLETDAGDTSSISTNDSVASICSSTSMTTNKVIEQQSSTECECKPKTIPASRKHKLFSRMCQII